MTESQAPLDSRPPLPGGKLPAKRAEGLAVAALILGVCAFIPFLGLLCGPAALILGIVALAKKTSRKGMAIAGIALCLIGLFVASVAYPPVGQVLYCNRQIGTAHPPTCPRNLRIIGRKLHEYAQENKGDFPPDLQTLIDEELIPEEALKCPSANSTRACDYFYLRPEGGLLAPSSAMIACDLKDNHAGKGRNVCYVDARVAWLSETEFQRELNLPENAKFAAALRAAE